MIKLKNILQESTKPEVGKITTAKDEPPFMTEEQWNAKWSKKDKVNESRPAAMAALMVGKIVFRVIWAWCKANPDKVKKLKDFVRKLDPTKPFRTP